MTYEDLKYDLVKNELNNHKLTKTEAALLRELLYKPGTVVQKDYLLNKVWRGAAYGKDNYVEVYVSRLRKILAEINSSVKIRTIKGFGYKMLAA